MVNMENLTAVRRTDNRDPDFLNLVGLLNEDLASRNGELQRQYNAYNSVDGIDAAVVAYCGCVPVACGAIRRHSDDTVEIKRMFVAASHRRMGLARQILSELENAARGLGYRRAILETGVRQVEAIGLYQSMGYRTIENYGGYAGNTNSVCMGKYL